MDILTELQKSLVCVAGADYFVEAMAAVTIVAMLIGSLLYNGDLNQLKKAVLTIFTYGGMIILTNVSRIITTTNGLQNLVMTQGQAFNGTTTVIYVTFFYVVGIALGVFAHWKARHPLKIKLWGREYYV